MAGVALGFCLIALIALGMSEARARQTQGRKTVTDCESLKNCLTSVAAQPGCGCQPGFEAELAKFNQCISTGVRDRCPSNGANSVCYNFDSEHCDNQIEKCYDRYHEDFTDAEERRYEECFMAESR